MQGVEPARPSVFIGGCGAARSKPRINDRAGARAIDCNGSTDRCSRSVPYLELNTEPFL